MKIAKLILSLFVVAMTVTSYAQTRDQIATKMNVAGESLNGKKYPEAIKQFTEALSMIKKSTEEGIDDLEKTATGFLADAYRMNGMTLAHGKKYDAALAEFKKAVDTYKKISNIQMQRKTEGLISSCYSGMAAAKVKTKNYEEAAAICLKGLEANKNDTKLVLLAAQCMEKANKDAEAIKLYEQVMTMAKTSPRLKADGDKAKGLLVNGMLADASKLADKGQTAPAIAKINAALKYDPKSSQAEYLRIQTYSKAGDNASVIKFAPVAVAAQPSAEMKSDIYYFVGVAYVKMEDNKNALVNYKKVTAGRNVATAKAQIESINKAATATEEQK